MKGYNGLGKCSACPKDCGDLFYCIDANFGLVLKKSASKTENVPRSYEKFVPDGAIKNFLENYDDSKSENKVMFLISLFYLKIRQVKIEKLIVIVEFKGMQQFSSWE